MFPRGETVSEFLGRWTSKTGWSTLSQNTLDYLAKTFPNWKKRSVPDWDQYFIQMAFLAAQRSRDAETHHGCVITDKKHRILGIGFNSFPRGMPDYLLPNSRGKDAGGRHNKYPWMAHSERNALANCSLRPEGATAYVTGIPCIPCLTALIQHGIKRLVLGSQYGSVITGDKEDQAIFEIMTKCRNIEVVHIKPDTTTLKQAIMQIEKAG